MGTEPAFRHFEDFTSAKDVTPCKGMIYRANVFHGKTERGMSYMIRLNFRKNLSCKGCSQCGGAEDALLEIGLDFPVAGITDVRHGELYRLGMQATSMNFKSGKPDDYKCALIHIEKE